MFFFVFFLHGLGGGPAGCHGEGETGTGGDESQAVVNSTLTCWEGRSPDCPASREAETPGGGPRNEVRTEKHAYFKSSLYINVRFTWTLPLYDLCTYIKMLPTIQLQIHQLLHQYLIYLHAQAQTYCICKMCLWGYVALTHSKMYLYVFHRFWRTLAYFQYSQKML